MWDGTFLTVCLVGERRERSGADLLPRLFGWGSDSKGIIPQDAVHSTPQNSRDGAALLQFLSIVSLPSPSRLSLSLSCLRQGRAGGVGMGGGDPRHAMVAQGGSKELPRRPLLHICITTADEARDRGGGTRGRATAGARPATVDLANR
jgi:hypothetical protein